eukprot:2377378-Pyramimonas_sp.AAC.1
MALLRGAEHYAAAWSLVGVDADSEMEREVLQQPTCQVPTGAVFRGADAGRVLAAAPKILECAQLSFGGIGSLPEPKNEMEVVVKVMQHCNLRTKQQCLLYLGFVNNRPRVIYARGRHQTVPHGAWCQYPMGIGITFHCKGDDALGWEHVFVEE